MPIIRVEMWSGRPQETKKQLIENITSTVCSTINCPPEAVIVVIDDIPKENWGQAGKQAK